MSNAAVADRYARAIFELAVESNQLSSVAQQLADFAATYAASPELTGILDNPQVPQEQREAILAEIAGRVGASGYVFNFLRLLASRNKLRALPEIARRFGSLSDEREGVVRATVTTAQPMPESFFSQLRSELEAAVSRKVVIERRQDPSLIAGVVTRIGDNTIDGSVKGRLAAIERQLLSLQ